MCACSLSKASLVLSRAERLVAVFALGVATFCFEHAGLACRRHGTASARAIASHHKVIAHRHTENSKAMLSSFANRTALMQRPPTMKGR